MDANTGRNALIGRSQVKPGKSLWYTVKKQRAWILMSFPFVLYCILFSYVPLWGWLSAFQDYKYGKSVFDQKWVGLKYFARLFDSPDFYLALRNTLAMSTINLVLGFVTAIGLALLLNEVKQMLFKRVIQTISYLPHFVSWVVAANIIFSMLSLDGPINYLLVSLGIVQEPVLFLGKGSWFWWIIGFANIWKEVGWNAIIYLASMSMINPDLYESADIDGANRFHKMRYITLPSIMPTAIVLLIISIGYILSSGFDQSYLLQNPMVRDYAENLDIYVLRTGVSMGQLSFGTAAGIFKSLVSLVLVLGANKLAKKSGHRGLL